MARKIASESNGSRNASGPNSRFRDFGGGQKPVDTKGIGTREAEADDFDYDRAIESANESDNPDGYKYQVAVQLAEDKAGDDVDDYEMRDLIDSEFAKLDPTASGAQMRGEDNIGAQAMGGLNRALNGVSDMIGGGLDALWDVGAGTAAGLIGGAAGALTGNEGWGDEASEFVRGLVGTEDDAVIDTRMLGNIALDLGLTAIPGVGVPLAMAKAGIQNSDNIRELVEGRDSLSRERIGSDAALSKLAATALDIGLSAAPGVGKLRNAAAADDILMSSGDDMMRALTEASTIGQGNLLRELSPAAMGRVAKNSAKETASRIGSAVDAARASSGTGFRNALGNARQALTMPSAEGFKRNAVEGVIQNLGRSNGGKVAKAAAGGDVAKAADDAILKQAAGESSKGFRNAVRDLAENPSLKNAGGRFAGWLGDRGQNLLGAGGNIVGSLGSAGVNYAAETNQGIGDGISGILEELGSGRQGNGMGDVLTLLAPIGANVIMGASSRPGVRGSLTKSNMPLRYVQMGEGGAIGRDEGQTARRDTMGNEDIYDWLAQMSAGDSE